MQPIALITRKQLLLIALFVFPCFSKAQQPDHLSGVYAQLNSQLDAEYSEALSRLTTSQQEPFLRAQLAWNIISDKEKALVNSLQSENFVPNGFAPSHTMIEIESRSMHLKAFFVDYKIDYPPQDTPQNQDDELNKIYAECMGRMTTSDQELLLSSERAWITYRDADIDAVIATGGNPIVKNAVIVTLSLQRIKSLTSIAHSMGQVPITNTPIQGVSTFLPQNSSPAAEDVKAMTEFQNGAKATLNALLANKTAPFFKTADAIKNVPELPAEISDQISKLHVQYDALSRKPDSINLLDPGLNECAAVELLSAWSKFTQQLKTGSADDAGSIIEKALSKKPKGITAAYLPLWQTAESWREVYVDDDLKFYEHILKAKSFGELGKTSAAIKEYQAAYDIIEDSTIPEKIKKLRDQSLGL